MARIHGQRGRLYVGLASGSATAEPVAFLTNWTLDQAADRSPVTSFGDTNVVTVAGLPNANGTFRGFYDTATDQLYTAALDGAARKTYLYPDISDSHYWFTTATFDWSIDVPVDGPVSISGSWSASSAVAKV